VTQTRGALVGSQAEHVRAESSDRLLVAFQMRTAGRTERGGTFAAGIMTSIESGTRGLDNPDSAEANRNVTWL
jgi:hypothetical protein